MKNLNKVIDLDKVKIFKFVPACYIFS